MRNGEEKERDIGRGREREREATLFAPVLKITSDTNEHGFHSVSLYLHHSHLIS